MFRAIRRTYRKHFDRKSTESLTNIIGQSNYQLLLNEVNKQISKSGVTVPFGITSDDLVVMYLYTHQELAVYHYRSINDVLRGASHRKSAEILKIADLLGAALEKLPPVKGHVFRITWLKGWLRVQHLIFSRITYHAYTSSSLLSNPPLAGNTDMFIVSKSGRDISWLSRFPSEQEVLIPHGAKFDILRTSMKSGRLQVVMKEI